MGVRQCQNRRSLKGGHPTMRNGRRSGVTLVQLLVVIPIIGILAALIFGGVWSALDRQKQRNTELTLTKVNLALGNQTQVVVDDAQRKPIPPQFLVWAANDTQLAREEFIVQSVELNFPNTKAGAMNGTALLAPLPAFQQAWAAARDGHDEKAACLYMILKRCPGFNDVGLNPQETLDRYGDGLKEVVDAYGEPLTTVRLPGHQATPENATINQVEALNPGISPEFAAHALRASPRRGSSSPPTVQHQARHETTAPVRPHRRFHTLALSTPRHLAATALSPNPRTPNPPPRPPSPPPPPPPPPPPVDLNAYTTEFFTNGGTNYGSCGAAAVVLVEAQINRQHSIPTDAVKTKNAAMVRAFNPSTIPGNGRTYYVYSLSNLITQLQNDGFTVANKGTTTRTQASQRIYDALSRGKWVIVVSLNDFSTNQLGHFYPVFGGDLVYDARGNIDETRSTITALQSFNPTNDSSKKTTKAYLNKVLDSMRLASTANPPMYNLIEVGR